MTSNNFESEGKNPKRKVIQNNILRILHANQDKALSSKELESILKVRRQGIHQGLRALEEKGLIMRGMMEGEKRNTYYATITQRGIKHVERQKERSGKMHKESQTGAKKNESANPKNSKTNDESNKG